MPFLKNGGNGLHRIGRLVFGECSASGFSAPTLLFSSLRQSPSLVYVVLQRGVAQPIGFA